MKPPTALSDHHDLSRFDSGVPALDDWLKRRARPNQAAGASRTYVLCDGEAVVGYYALASGAVALPQAPSRLRRNMPDPIPVALLGRLESAHKNDMALQWLLGAALVRTGKKQEGLLRLDGPARQGKSAEACLLAGQTAMEIHEYELAREYAELALKINPNLPGVWTLAGMTRHYLADNEGAMEAFAKALAANPDDFEALLGTGTVLLVKRDLDGARRHLEKALKLKPADKLAHYQMGRLERTAGNIEAAVKHLELVVKTDPDWAQPHIELSALYFRLNRPEDGERERALFDKLNAKGQ